MDIIFGMFFLKTNLYDGFGKEHKGDAYNPNN